MQNQEEVTFRRGAEDAARLGHPSYVWRAGQARRLDLVRGHVRLEGARILDAGCGVGAYTAQFCRFSALVTGVEIDFAAAARASRVGQVSGTCRAAHGYRKQGTEGDAAAQTRPGDPSSTSAGEGLTRPPGIIVAPAEALPFADGSFDVVFSHEVIEHVRDDRAAAREMVRVAAPSGKIVIFAPNRLYPFETHGHYWRGRYHFGNTPFVNWLPDPLRDRLAPHVRAYTGGGLRALFAGQPVQLVHHSLIYPGFDNVVARRPALGQVLRRVLYALEHTPLQAFGLSHFLILAKEN